jgi:hypothetical protein
MKPSLLIIGGLCVVAGIIIPTVPLLNIIICGTICIALIILGAILFVAGVVL